MAKQDINLGTQPTGVGGDTNRSANIKTNANLKEIYTALGGSVSGGNGSVLPNSLPIGKGGTGATTAAAARTALGLGTVATMNLTTSYLDTTLNRVIKIGDWGLGSVVQGTPLKENEVNDLNGSGFFSTSSSWNNSVRDGISGANQGAGINISTLGGLYSIQIWNPIQSYGPNIRIKNNHVWDDWAKLYCSRNTTVDSNGFIKAASPIVELYADRIELNKEAKQQNITFEKLGIGDYIIKGSSGFAQSGWYVEQPKDANGNVCHAVIYNTLENGDISVKTYEQKIDGVKIVPDLDKPVDVKENRFIAIRLQELPQEPIEEPQPEPTITDYQGNPAPSRLHELVDGTWTISGENAAILESERLAAMQPLTRRQFRLVLALNGYDLSQIETLINSIEDPMQRQITMIEWQDATTFHRTNPSLIVMAGLMGLDAETVDQLWLQASTL